MKVYSAHTIGSTCDRYYPAWIFRFDYDDTIVEHLHEGGRSSEERVNPSGLLQFALTG